MYLYVLYICVCVCVWNTEVAALFLNLPTPGRFFPSENTTGNYCVRGMVGPRAGLDDWKKKTEVS